MKSIWKIQDFLEDWTLTVPFKGQKPVRGMDYQVLNKNENEQQNNLEMHQKQNQKVAVGVERLRKRKLVSGETRRSKLLDR